MALSTTSSESTGEACEAGTEHQGRREATDGEDEGCLAAEGAVASPCSRVSLRHRLAVRVSSRGGASPERECGPQEGPEQRPARGPLPSTEASIVIMLSLCPGGRLRTGVHAGRRPFLFQILGVSRPDS